MPNSFNQHIRQTSERFRVYGIEKHFSRDLTPAFIRSVLVNSSRYYQIMIIYELDSRLIREIAINLVVELLALFDIIIGNRSRLII